MAPTRSSGHLRRQFWHGDDHFFSKTMTVYALYDKLDNNVKGFYFSTFYKVSAVSNAMGGEILPAKFWNF
jgi:hypothetical protein